MRISQAAFDLIATLCANEKAKAHHFRDLSNDTTSELLKIQFFRKSRQSDTRYNLLTEVVKSVSVLGGDHGRD